MKSLFTAVLLGCLVAALVDAQKVTWCVTSDQEYAKCETLKGISELECIKRNNLVDCMIAIKNSEADAITLDGGEIYTAGLDDYQLHPIIAEQYHSASETCYFAVAVAKKGTNFGLRDLKGKKSCHTGLGKSAGWNIPVGTLLSMGVLEWQGSDNKALEDVVGDFFGGSCAPGATPNSKLCALCNNDCSKTSSNPYYNYDGAFRCLKEGRGDVAFIKHLTVPDAEKQNYELLCLDNTRAPIDDYKRCNLQRVPAHAVVTRKNQNIEDLIWNTLDKLQRENRASLFTSVNGKNLMFKDSAESLVRLPPNTDSFTYLGVKYMTVLESLKRVNIPTSVSAGIRWCVLGENEKKKCDFWNLNTAELTCVIGESPEHCLQLIMRSDADAVTLDGGQVYTAGRCGLVPAMVEQYTNDCSPEAEGSSYYAVAVIRKGSGVTWDNLQNKKSCHTGFGRNAGWNIPMGRIHEKIQSCDFKSFFSQSCAPGADESSSLCSLCVGNGNNQYKCKPTSEEQYNGYVGALKCLADGAGDVAFTKYSAVIDNSNGNGLNLNLDEYQLICPDKGPVPVNQYANCHLAQVPAHAVVTRPDIRNNVVKFLKAEEAKYGPSGGPFKMFVSKTDMYTGSNLMFKDRTQCLKEVPAGQNFEEFLGQEYMKVMKSLRKCEENTSALEKSCTFHPCQENM